jgi:hypothetical protein
MKKLVLGAFVVLLLAVLTAGTVAAQDGTVEEVPSLVDALGMLSQGVGVGLVLAFLAEKVLAFQTLSAQAKGWVIFGVSMGLPLVATVILNLVPADILNVAEPYWHALAVGFIGWAGSQALYQGIIKPAAAARKWDVIGK